MSQQKTELLQRPLRVQAEPKSLTSLCVCNSHTCQLVACAAKRHEPDIWHGQPSPQSVSLLAKVTFKTTSSSRHLRKRANMVNAGGMATQQANIPATSAASFWLVGLPLLQEVCHCERQLYDQEGARLSVNGQLAVMWQDLGMQVDLYDFVLWASGARNSAS